jgi:F0F1-type ATP synthase assembly protein I
VISAQRHWPIALRVCGIQGALTLGVALVWWLAGGSVTGALLGGLVATVLSLYFAVRVLSVDAAADPRGFLRRFMRAEAMKLLLAMVFFVWVARQMPQVMPEAISSFAVTLLAYWFALAWVR